MKPSQNSFLLRLLFSLFFCVPFASAAIVIRNYWITSPKTGWDALGDFLAYFTLFTLIGLVLGYFISKFLEKRKLIMATVLCVIFVVAMGLYIQIKNNRIKNAHEKIELPIAPKPSPQD